MQDETYKDTLIQLRNAVSQQIRDTKDVGFLIPSTREKDRPLYTWVRETNYPHEDLIKVVETASEDNPQHRGRCYSILAATLQNFVSGVLQDLLI